MRPLVAICYTVWIIIRDRPHRIRNSCCHRVRPARFDLRSPSGAFRGETMSRGGIMSFKRSFRGRGFRGYALGALAALAMLLAASPSRADTAVSSCMTLATRGNYFLTKNLTSAGTCIVIGDEGVSFDMNGHTITGSGPGGGIVAAASGGDTTVSNSTVTGNGGAGVFLDGCCSFLVSSKVMGSKVDGVDMNDCCNFVINSTVAFNVGIGVSLIEDDNLVIGTSVFSNGGERIFLSNDTNHITNRSSTGKGGF